MALVRFPKCITSKGNSRKTKSSKMASSRAIIQEFLRLIWCFIYLDGDDIDC